MCLMTPFQLICLKIERGRTSCVCGQENLGMEIASLNMLHTPSTVAAPSECLLITLPQTMWVPVELCGSNAV
jgi:hypothetical protein